VIFDRVLAAAGHEYDFFDSRVDCFLNHQLDSGHVDDGE
jgi:hypothetical protein